MAKATLSKQKSNSCRRQQLFRKAELKKKSSEFLKLWLDNNNNIISLSNIPGNCGNVIKNSLWKFQPEANTYYEKIRAKTSQSYRQPLYNGTSQKTPIISNHTCHIKPCLCHRGKEKINILLSFGLCAFSMLSLTSITTVFLLNIVLQ